MLAVLTIVLAMATYRTSVLLARDDGPLNCIKGTRERLEKWGTWNPICAFAGELMSCPRCNSVWLGVAFGLLWASALELSWVLGISAGLAFSGVTIWLDSRVP